MRALTLACVFLTTLSTQIAVAEEPHPGSDAAPVRLLRPDYRTLLGITLGKSSFEEVQREFGPTRVLDHGSDCGHTQRLCYASSHQGDTTTLLFSRSHGRELTGFVLLHQRPAELAEADCTATPRVHRKLTTASNLRLGLSAERVRQAVPFSAKELRESTLPYQSVERLSSSEEPEGLSRCVPYEGPPRVGTGTECITSKLSFEADSLTGLSVDHLIVF
ncbi:hypothetical protein [Pyxidicoccus xibeiensis]|uniref:hypothetical protein n=1 Tax=Pyxidicoccus xibeiensis TaxID=2906759 RepID=UPI0020A70135|nr:hypothetical protein [Pyxidicoccus xibeiensis]MCP3139061.1 hypothetical protein [Pyxidicoccus xibeiensis]